MSYDVYGIGAALVDMEYSVDDGFLDHHGIAQGAHDPRRRVAPARP